MPDEVRLRVAGREFAGWTGVSISMTIDQVADAFSLSLPYDPARAELRAAFKPFGYQPVQVYLDEDLLITGRVDKVEAKSDAGDRSLTVQGRSLPGALVDCGIEGPLEFSGLALSTIARQVCRSFGVQVRADNDTAPIEVARAEYGQAAAEFLMSLASPRNLFLNSSHDGKLVISWARTLASLPPVAALVEGQGQVLSVSADFDGTARFSKYKTASQYAGAPDIIGQVADPAIAVYRPRLLAVSDTDADPGRTAARARAAAIAGSLSVSVTLAGWRRPDGGHWEERQAVTLLAPGTLLVIEAKYIIAGLTLRIDENEGKVAELRLVLPELYAGELPKVTPWA